MEVTLVACGTVASVLFVSLLLLVLRSQSFKNRVAIAMVRMQQISKGRNRPSSSLPGDDLHNANSGQEATKNKPLTPEPHCRASGTSRSRETLEGGETRVDMGQGLKRQLLLLHHPARDKGRLEGRPLCPCWVQTAPSSSRLPRRGTTAKERRKGGDLGLSVAQQDRDIRL